MALEKISISGISDVYAVSAIKKEFKKAVKMQWWCLAPLNFYILYCGNEISSCWTEMRAEFGQGKKS